MKTLNDILNEMPETFDFFDFFEKAGKTYSIDEMYSFLKTNCFRNNWKKWLKTPKPKPLLITLEQQQALIDNYAKRAVNNSEVLGFIEGVEAVMDLISK